MELEVIGIKVTAVVLIFLTCFIGALLPVKLTKCFGNQNQFLSWANCVGAGILLGASWCHLMSDAETTDSGAESPLGHTGNHFLVGLGFLGSFVLEKVLFELPHEHVGSVSAESGHSHLSKSSLEESQEPIITEDDDKSINLEMKEVITTPSEEKLIQPESELSESSSSSEDLEESEDHHHEHEHKEHQVKQDSHSHGASQLKKIPYMLFVVLSLETFISGSALGVQQKRSKVLVTFIAIVTHIWAEAFTLSACLLKAKVSDSNIIKSMLAFSSLGPVSIAVGIILANILSGAVIDIISSVLVSLAAGTFVYVAIVEILMEEFEKHESKRYKFALVFIGYSFMAALAFAFEYLGE